MGKLDGSIVFYLPLLCSTVRYDDRGFGVRVSTLDENAYKHLWGRGQKTGKTTKN